jgi:hypothetical protein
MLASSPLTSLNTAAAHLQRLEALRQVLAADHLGRHALVEVLASVCKQGRVAQRLPRLISVQRIQQLSQPVDLGAAAAHAQLTCERRGSRDGNASTPPHRLAGVCPVRARYPPFWP